MDPGGLTISVRHEAGYVLITAAGEIGITNAARLRAALLRAATARPGTDLVVDMTRTRFWDSAGLHTLLAAHRRRRSRSAARTRNPAGARRRYRPAGSLVRSSSLASRSRSSSRDRAASVIDWIARSLVSIGTGSACAVTSMTPLTKACAARTHTTTDNRNHRTGPPCDASSLDGG